MSVAPIRGAGGSIPFSRYELPELQQASADPVAPSPLVRALRADGFDARPPAIDIDRAVRQLNGAAGAQSQGLCATYVRRALRAGGMDTSNNPTHARDYGPYLESRGFQRVDASTYTPRRGDVVVLQAPPGVPAAASGHVAMYNGAQWVSDFRQRDMWAGPDFRNGATYQIYRP